MILKTLLPFVGEETFDRTQKRVFYLGSIWLLLVQILFQKKMNEIYKHSKKSITSFPMCDVIFFER